MKLPNWLAVLIVAALLAGGALLAAYHHAPSPSQPAAVTCTASPTEVCPSDQFLKDYDKMLGIRTKVQKDMQAQVVTSVQDEQDQLTGIIDRLSRQVPQGYRFDEAKHRFIQMPPPPPPAPLATPEKK